MKIRKAIIIDDEPFVRDDLRYLLDAHPSIEIVGEAGSVHESRELLGSASPDVVFLDIQLRGGSGFDLLPNIPESTDIIFFTASDDFQETVERNQVIDYLLKPVSPARLASSLEKLK